MRGPEEGRQRKRQKKYQKDQSGSNSEVPLTTLPWMREARGHWGVMRGPVSLNSELHLREGQLSQQCTGNHALGYIRPLAVSRSPSGVPQPQSHKAEKAQRGEPPAQPTKLGLELPLH